MTELAAAAKSVSAWDQPGTLGFLVVFGMAVILYFVFRSLSRHLRKVNEAARLEAAEGESAQAGPLQGKSAQGNSAQGNSVQASSMEAGSAQAGSAPGSHGR